MRNLVLGLLVAFAAGAGAEWEIVSSEDLAASSTELGAGKEVLVAVPDAGGGVSFVYHHGGLKFGRWPGEGTDFEYSLIDPDSGDLYGVVLAAGPDGRPHVAYWSQDDVTYAFYNGVSWSRSAVPTEGLELIGDCGGVWLAVDSRNGPHLIINGLHETSELGESVKGLIIYANRREGRWRTERVDSFIAPWVRGVHASLAVDGDGAAHVCYCWPKREREELICLHNTRGAWEKELVTSGWRSFYPSLAFDAAGRLHVAYFDESRGDLKYASRENGRWEIETVEDLGWVGVRAVLAFGPGDVPWISYYEYGPKYAEYFYAKVARRTGRGWEVSTVEKLRNSPHKEERVPRTAINVDGRGRPHVVYGEFTGYYDTHLKSAKWMGNGQPPADPPKKICFAQTAKPPEIYDWGAGGELPLYPPDVLHAEPDADSAVLATFEYDDDTPYEILDVKSILRYNDFNFRPAYEYDAWFNVRRGGYVGWSMGVGILDISCLVEFRQPYAPLREGPSSSAPAIESERFDYADQQRLALTPDVPAGSIYRLHSAYNGWYCVGNFSDGAWVPADAPEVTLYREVFHWWPDTEAYDEDFSFFFPVRGAVGRIIIRNGCFLRWERLSGDDPVLRITTSKDEFVLLPEYVTSKGYYEGWNDYFIVQLPRAVSRDEIKAVTFETGSPAQRYKVTVDPREAWAEYDAGQ